MARINLLPWRAERQKQRQKQFFLMLAMSALGAVLLWFLINMHYNADLAGQQARNAFLDDEIATVETKLTEIKTLKEKRDKLLARKQVIEELQGNRSQMVHLFDSLVRTIPDGVILTSIKQEGDKLTLEGRAQSNSRVSTYMRNFEGSTWMSKPELSVIEAKGEDKGLPYVFNLSVTLVNPNKQEEGEGDTAAATPEGTVPATPGTLPTLTPATPAGQTPPPAPGAAAPAPAAAPTTAPATPAKTENTSPTEGGPAS